jgi:hypothetical protein
VADAERPQPQTTIVARPGARSAAEQIASLLKVPAARVSENPNLGGSADVRVVLGADAG